MIIFIFLQEQCRASVEDFADYKDVIVFYVFLCLVAKSFVCIVKVARCSFSQTQKCTSLLLAEMSVFVLRAKTAQVTLRKLNKNNLNYVKPLWFMHPVSCPKTLVTQWPWVGLALSSLAWLSCLCFANNAILGILFLLNYMMCTADFVAHVVGQCVWWKPVFISEV